MPLNNTVYDFTICRISVPPMSLVSFFRDPLVSACVGLCPNWVHSLSLSVESKPATLQRKLRQPKCDVSTKLETQPWAQVFQTTHCTKRCCQILSIKDVSYQIQSNTDQANASYLEILGIET